MVVVGRTSPLLALLLTALALVAYAILAWRARNARVIVDDSQITIREVFRTYQVVRADIVTVAFAPHLVNSGYVGVNGMLLLLDKAGHSLARLPSPYWPRSTLQAIAARLGGPTWSSADPISRADLTGLFPNAI